ncbi:S9 family peptidase [Marinobacterium marinum]|uniref:S9 family peptidase n=1 Tax=Marinobacterium marinum TaxID=2756129 RepID=A0A7W1WY06_9GAMM|nr:prolyl oligopeptidase family serine peptidase [Marinobacterium marinum]MBA4502176.1 S9 family peptidase [Marinobacterium marinum]
MAELRPTAREAVTAMHDYAGLRFYRDSILGVSFEAGTGRNRLCRFQAGQAISMLPEVFSVRSRVHEYGGGAWCLAGDQVCFVNEQDQQVWCVDLPGQGRPQQLTFAEGTRFADMLYVPVLQSVLAISECHTGVGTEASNRLVVIDLHRGSVNTLAEGADFYSSPAISPNGQQLAWVEWDHPRQPWCSTRLVLAQLNLEGEIVQRQVISDSYLEAAWAQPRFAPDGRLHAVVDRDNWWRIEVYTDTGWKALGPACPSNTEFTTAPWQFGLATYGWNAAGELLALGQCGGYSTLWRYDERGWQILRPGLEQTPTRLHSLVCQDNRMACVAEFGGCEPAILELSGSEHEDGVVPCRIVHGGSRPEFVPSLPVSLSIGEDEHEIPCFLYRPLDASPGQPLPTVIWTHGGPTATTAPVFKPAIQYWTRRGFMIVDVNYRGSTGYGRDYRMQLAGQWGCADVDDVVRVARALIQQGMADADAVFIRGNSAGGYTTLNALRHTDLFRGGASLYGVSDPARLGQLTHKFESRYLHWLIGAPDREAERYRVRSPLLNAGQIDVPVIFFQGEQDRVVLPEQTRDMAACLMARQIRVETHFFADEAHGFRRPENQAQVLEQELAFFRSIMALPAD